MLHRVDLERALEEVKLVLGEVGKTTAERLREQDDEWETGNGSGIVLAVILGLLAWSVIAALWWVRK